MIAILAWLGGRIAVPVAMLCALLLGCGLIWQTGRIDGWPLTGGGYKAQVAGLQQQLAARELAAAQVQAAALTARQKIEDAANDAARAHVVRDQSIQTQIQTLTREVPHYVDAKSDAACVLNWGAVRLLDAAASGAGLGDVAAHIAPGQPDDGASDVKLSEAAALLAGNLGIARQNADQLTQLQKAAAP